MSGMARSSSSGMRIFQFSSVTEESCLRVATRLYWTIFSYYSVAPMKRASNIVRPIPPWRQQCNSAISGNKPEEVRFLNRHPSFGGSQGLGICANRSRDERRIRSMTGALHVIVQKVNLFAQLAGLRPAGWPSAGCALWLAAGCATDPDADGQPASDRRRSLRRVLQERSGAGCESRRRPAPV